ncbi:MAG: mechanosensitive ion channel family protein [Candidatus Hodarchaeota archaeon]
MAIFRTDFEALIYLLIIGIGLYLANKLISFVVRKSKKITMKHKIIVNFVFKIAAVLIVIFFIIEGFPIISQIDPTYTAIFTGAISTAIAFASSGIFGNFISGIVIMLVRPFEVDDLVKIEGDKGVVRAITITRTKLETFDNIILEIANSQVISSKLVNYTVKLGKKKNFEEFKRKILAPQDTGFQDLFEGIPANKVDLENNIKKVYESYSKKELPKLYNFTFRMAFPYKAFRLISKEVVELCNQYNVKNIFRIKPQFDVINFGLNIIVKFRLLTFNVQKIFDFQPQFADDVNKIIYQFKNI